MLKQDPFVCVIGIKLTEADQELYKNFPVVISERWQQEIAETVFENVNQETDKKELKNKAKSKVMSMAALKAFYDSSRRFPSDSVFSNSKISLKSHSSSL